MIEPTGDDRPQDRSLDVAVGDDLDQGEIRERRTGRRGGRRRGGAPTVSIISWRDIPAQITARSGDESGKVLLHARFQHAIDRAAGVAGLTSTDDYVREWRTTVEPLDDGDVASGADTGASGADLGARLDRRCATLEARYPRERLEALVANGGLEPTPATDHDTHDGADAPASAPDGDTSHSESDHA